MSQPVHARKFVRGKPIGILPTIESKATFIEKTADAVEQKLARFAAIDTNCGTCNGARQTIASTATRALRKVVPRKG